MNLPMEHDPLFEYPSAYCLYQDAERGMELRLIATIPGHAECELFGEIARNSENSVALKVVAAPLTAFVSTPDIQMPEYEQALLHSNLQASDEIPVHSQSKLPDPLPDEIRPQSENCVASEVSGHSDFQLQPLKEIPLHLDLETFDEVAGRSESYGASEVPGHSEFPFEQPFDRIPGPFESELLDEVASERQNNIASEVVTAESAMFASTPPIELPIPDQEIQEDTSPAYTVKIPGNIASVPLVDERISIQVEMMVSTMIGKRNYLQMKKSGSCLLHDVLSSLPRLLRDLQDKEKRDFGNALRLLREEDTNIENKLEEIYFPLSLKLKKNGHTFLPELRSRAAESLQTLQETQTNEVTLEEVNNEASKWIYFHLRAQNPGVHVVAHPEHIKNIPGDWRMEHPDCDARKRCYPTGAAYQSIAEYTGLEVQDLFQNNRKRRMSKVPELASVLKKHFSKDVTDKLRDWKVQNPGKSHPDKPSRSALMNETGMDENQIVYWFGNNAPGREKRNLPKKRRHTEKLLPRKKIAQNSEIIKARVEAQ